MRRNVAPAETVGIQPRHHRQFMVTYFQIVIIAMFYGLLSATNVLILIISPVKKGVYQVLITIQRYDFSKGYSPLKCYLCSSNFSIKLLRGKRFSVVFLYIFRQNLHLVWFII